MGTLARMLRDPMSEGWLRPPWAVATIAASSVVDAWFQRVSFFSLSVWLLEGMLGYSPADAQTSVAKAVAMQATPVWLQLLYGLLMTAFALAFLIPSAHLEERAAGCSRSATQRLGRASAWLVVPTLLMLVASLVMRTSLALGAALALAAAVCCAAILLRSCEKVRLNGHVAIALATTLLLLTAAMLVRNHIVTLGTLL